MAKDRLFDAKSDWNPRMWKGAHHEHNPHGDGEWNIAHVRNNLASYGRVPEKYHTQSIDLFDGLLSTAINDQRSLYRIRYERRDMCADFAKIRVYLRRQPPDLISIMAITERWASE